MSLCWVFKKIQPSYLGPHLPDSGQPSLQLVPSQLVSPHSTLNITGLSHTNWPCLSRTFLHGLPTATFATYFLSFLPKEVSHIHPSADCRVTLLLLDTHCCLLISFLGQFISVGLDMSQACFPQVCVGSLGLYVAELKSTGIVKREGEVCGSY